MMICPETFYEMHLKGKTAEEIMTEIRKLKREIGRLKNVMEHPEYVCTMHPSEDVRISCSRDYLKRAIEAYSKAGGEYVPSAAEKKAMDFDQNIPHISKIEFTIGGFFEGFRTSTYIVEGDKIHANFVLPLTDPLTDTSDSELEGISMDFFYHELYELHIGEWRKTYDTKRFGYTVCDGTQWHLEIYFSNDHKPVKISGSNSYPYNFNRLLNFFCEPELEDEED